MEHITDDTGKLIVKTYVYPRLTLNMVNDELLEKISYIKHRGRAFRFLRHNFVSEEEDKCIIYKEDDKPDYYSIKKKQLK